MRMGWKLPLKQVQRMLCHYNLLKQKSAPTHPKSPAMNEFADEFPYEPTPDQKQAFIDVVKDLTERETPMDRLICGDVGLEKEEYPSMIKDGHLDIIVGTHSLLGSHVVYSNLGLLAVDEEQIWCQTKGEDCFLQTSVDVLTLSATPIPQTIYLALTGFHDTSLISTLPSERVPIRTHLHAFSKDQVISAIKYELDRYGQVFYVLPRIKGLDEVMVQNSFSDIEIGIAYVKQYSEETMEKFAFGQIKILICTNIVGSLLDIQMQIIIQDVRQFGLAQIHTS